MSTSECVPEQGAEQNGGQEPEAVVAAARPPRIFSVFQWVLLFFACAYIALSLYVCLSRIAYPFELECTEGSIVECVQRVLDGKSLYVSPSLDFTCYQYPPLYFWVSAAAAKVLGIGFFPLRLVSFLSTLGTFGLIFALVRAETKSAIWGVIAVGLYAAMFDTVAFWFDIARVDCLFVFLLLAAVYATRRLKLTYGNAFIIALLFVAAYFTKQPAVFVAVPVMAYAVLLDWRRGLLLASVFVIMVLCGTALLDRATGHWYTFYSVTLLRQHGINHLVWVTFWLGDMLFQVPVALLGALAYAAPQVSARERRALFYPFFLCGAVAASWVSRLHAGGGPNVLIPVCVALAIGMTLLLARTAERKRPLRFASLSVLVMAQFLWLTYTPSDRIPTAKDYEAGMKFIEALRGIDGEVYISSSGFYASLAGKKPYMNIITGNDIMRGTDKELKDKIVRELTEATQQKKFAAMFYPNKCLREPLGYGYIKLPYPVFDDDTVFRPVIGLKIRPDEIYVPPDSPLLQLRGPLVRTKDP